MVFNFKKTIKTIKTIETVSTFDLITAFFFILLATYRDFDHHVKLPQLSTDLYWSHSPVTSIFSVSIEATLPSLKGTTIANSNSTWVAWGINPTGSGLIGTKFILLSLDSNREVAMKMYNVTYSDSAMAILEAESFWGEIVTFDSSFSLGLMKFDAKIAFPENRETVNHVVMMGEGNFSLLNTDMKSFGVLNLTKRKQSVFMKIVDAYSRAFTFEKECTLGRKMASWDNYITANNMGVVFSYTLIMLSMCNIEFTDDIWKYEFQKRLCVGMSVMCIVTMIILLKIKEKGEFCFSLLPSFHCCLSYR